jgi:hypothetical protein
MIASPELAVGDCLGVTVDVAAWDAVRAPVDLSVACMFALEPVGAMLAGGLLHLDEALGQTLTRLRAEGTFAAETMQTLLIRQPPATLAGKALLVVGLGQPQAWSPGVMAQAVGKTVAVAAALDAASVAFAPSIQDAGLAAPVLRPFDQAMVDGLVAGLTLAARLEALEMAAPIALRRWTFDANAGHAVQVAAAFRQALAAQPPRP